MQSALKGSRDSQSGSRGVQLPPSDGPTRKSSSGIADTKSAGKAAMAGDDASRLSKERRFSKEGQSPAVDGEAIVSRKSAIEDRQPAQERVFGERRCALHTSCPPPRPPRAMSIRLSTSLI